MKPMHIYSHNGITYIFCFDKKGLDKKELRKLAKGRLLRKMEHYTPVGDRFELTYISYEIQQD